MATISNNQVNLVEKNIAFKIAQQFPAIYREEGQELVQLVVDYYKWQETASDQGIYNSRRLFDYRDIGNTLESMLVFFQKKFMADLPILDDASLRFVVKNILDLYRRKGTESGIQLFFRLFFAEDVQIRYPGKHMLYPSNSNWKTGVYLQLFPNNDTFYVADGSSYYTYLDLVSKDIYGSISKAKAIVDKVNFIMLNNTLTPILYITEVRGKFTKYDDIISRFNGEDIAFGRLNGSADGLEIDIAYGGTTGNKIGDILDIQSEYGKGGKAIVTGTQDEFTGTVEYTILDGGFGYTVENTYLEVSNQAIILDNPNLQFELLEYLEDTAGNRGRVIGQNSVAVGVKMDPGDEFAINRAISTADRGASNFTLSGIYSISPKNESSPGPLYPDTGDANTSVIIGELTNVQNISLITDIIGNFLNVPLNSADFNAVPPALVPMSGTASPVTLATSLDTAFDLTPFDIGTIGSFLNINPGADYINDVFTLARDYQMMAFERFDQIILVSNFSANFSIGDTVTQAGINGIITDVNSTEEYIKIRPFGYYGFNSALSAGPMLHKGISYTILAVERDYTSNKYGANANIKSETLFSTGRISKAEIRNSGFGYIDGETVFLVDENGDIMAKATLSASSQGITSGFWSSESSHVNGYWTNPESHKFEYYDSKMKIQDSDYYQEFSYEIISTIDKGRYEKIIKDNVHLAGTKLFGDFVYNKKTSLGIKSRFQQFIKQDNIIGGPPIVGPNQQVGAQTVTVDNSIFTADTTAFKADKN